MDAFPADYVVHNLPLILLSGLEDDVLGSVSIDRSRTLLQEGGFRIKTNIPAVKDETSQALLHALLSHDSSESPWSSKHVAQKGDKSNFRIKSIGRTYTLPPRKAPPPPRSPRLRADDNTSPPPPMILHSVLSPLTPSSPLYPDGIMSPLWVTKHQSLLPSVFVSFFSLTSDQRTSTLEDNKLKAEMYDIRNILTSTSYKAKFVCVLIGNDEIPSTEVDERVGNIRRAAGLDNKSLSFLPANSTGEEIAAFTDSFLSTLHPFSIEHYRDLSKHARRKRNRNVIPQPTVQPTMGTTQVLSAQGWNVRYEFKLGVFAEFRQEMDAAVRNFESAYEILFGAELFDAIPSWSPRFNQARLLSDIIAIRIIRCLLWNSQTTNAVKLWSSHRDRIRDILNHRGAGTENYGWESWQSIWSRTMAELIQRTNVLSSSSDDQTGGMLASSMLHSQRMAHPTERFSPWQSLHHEGYWFNIAQQHVQQRRIRAHQMPEEDRASPEQSPASTIASRAHLYDTYLTNEPHKELPLDGQPAHNYQAEIVSDIDRAIHHFSAHDQSRMAVILTFRKAAELVQSSLWDQALLTLLPIWSDNLLRQEGWSTILVEIGRLLLSSAIGTRNTEKLVALDWELSHPMLSVQDIPKTEIDRVLNINDNRVLPRIALTTDSCLSPISVHFAFATDEGHVGRPIDAQLSIQNISTSSRVMSITEIKVVFEGGLRTCYIVHKTETKDTGQAPNVQIMDVQMSDETTDSSHKNKRSSIGTNAHLIAFADLNVQAGQTKVLQLRLVPREAGELSVASATVQLDPEQYQLNIMTTHDDLAASSWWEMRSGKPVSRLCGNQRNVALVEILPKPPKLEITLPSASTVYYTNEDIDLVVDFLNDEEGVILGYIDVRLISTGASAAAIAWVGEELSSTPDTQPSNFEYVLPRISLEQKAAGERASKMLRITNTHDAMDHELEVVVIYTLLSSPENVLKKVSVIDIPVVRPFEANFGFHSRLHPEPWPDFFSPSTVSKDRYRAVGIKQQYSVSAVVCSFAVEEISITSALLTTEKVIGNVLCSTSEGVPQKDESVDSVDASPTNSVDLRSEQTQKFTFDMTLQKLVLGDRQPVGVDLILQLIWRRKSSPKVNVSTLEVPRFLAPSSEPRVLIESLEDDEVPGAHRLDYTIENPTLHFLTFNLTMESTEDFAFSGPKSQSVSVVPISRHDVQYCIVPTKTEEWIKVNLKVVDAYFGQTLQVQPASEGIKVDKQGNVLVRVGKR